MSYLNAHKALMKLAQPGKAKFASRFFKTGKGEYGEGDKFLGITVPEIRILAKEFKDLPLEDCCKLLESPYNEERSLALFILNAQFKRGDEKVQEKIYKIYLEKRKYVNNWNLVDASASYIVGPYIFNRDRSILYELARSKNLWDKRIAIISTFHFIREKDFKDTIRLCELFLKEEHDLMHKACGWMLREMGKKDVDELRRFLKKHKDKMPRTMLRYAIEKFPEKERKSYL